ncbi:nucleotide-binding universal stress UspA family protein [Paucimonas lemoignei]|uniref:Nucleotide-binding universal stress UspA family protein n=1 Tax=Paucimonas lemoignei TaxID=29443 RepID=A0A4R3I3E6_PAULE|nr:universal stress protein [Paucimonas lemoignei]TCS39341.1 nucleotide-binding universal stress UspA family protein [Paucimonas lemoignei]
MFVLERILLATDLTVRSISAELRAAQLCEDLRLDSLDVMTVRRTYAANWFDRLRSNAVLASPDSDRDQVQRQFRFAQSRIRARHAIQCHYSIRSGDVPTAIIGMADETDAGMIVVGHERRSRLGNLLGSTAERLLGVADRPLLLVRNQPCSPYRTVLIPVDFSLEALNAARLALSIAPDAHHVFLHAFRMGEEGQMREAGLSEAVIGDYRSKRWAQAAQDLEQFIAELGPVRQTITGEIAYGWTVPMIAAVANKINPDLIVLGKHSASRTEEFLTGNVTRRAISQTSGDVLVIPRMDPGKDSWFERPAA